MSDDPLVGVSELDEVALAAVSAIDDGDLAKLGDVLSRNPGLVDERLPCGSGYFHRPYLLWFVAGNPVRKERLPGNAPAVARVIIDFARRTGVATLQEQIDYTLSLVGSGRVPRESGVQLALIDALVQAGADPDGALGPALAHREEAAVRRLVERGAPVTLVVASALGDVGQLRRLAGIADVRERRSALAVAAIWGRADSVRELTAREIDLDAYNPPGFHGHATALHSAVAAHSPATVRALLDAGASPAIKDGIWGGTALDWAEHLGDQEIASQLRARDSRWGGEG